MNGRASSSTVKALSVGVIAMFAVAGCANSGGGTKSASNAGAGGGASTSMSGGGGTQQATVAAGTCTYKTYDGGVPKLDLKSTTVGFSQSESTSNPFRETETKSITDQAKKLGIKLIQTNAGGDVSKQNNDIESLIAQGAKVLIVAPENNTGVASALAHAKAKKIPVLTIDRTAGTAACKDFISFIGSDFTGQAKIAADDLGAALGGKGDIAVLQGTPGNNVAQERTTGFTKELKAKYPGIKIVAMQTANFDQPTGQKVMAQMLQAHPDINGLYAENDGMALGALQSIRQAGKVPGKDIKVVSIDGTSDIVKLVASGQVVSDIETNPRFGPLAFEVLTKLYDGTGVPDKVIIKDHHFTKDNAQQALSSGDVY